MDAESHLRSVLQDVANSAAAPDDRVVVVRMAREVWDRVKGITSGSRKQGYLNQLKNRATARSWEIVENLCEEGFIKSRDEDERQEIAELIHPILMRMVQDSDEIR